MRLNPNRSEPLKLSSTMEDCTNTPAAKLKHAIHPDRQKRNKHAERERQGRHAQGTARVRREERLNLLEDERFRSKTSGDEALTARRETQRSQGG